jgi:6-phosphogluconolactonase
MTAPSSPQIEILPSAAFAAERAADLLSTYVREDVARDGRATFAVSGGRTPQRMLEALASAGVPWDLVDLFQVDERVAPSGDPDRNATQAAAALANPLLRHTASFHWMPVEEPDLEAAAAEYAATLRAAAGSPPALGTVQLGLGADGHTASIFPGSSLADSSPGDVAVTGPHQGRRRMTLTLDTLNRARRILWVVTGAEKRTALARLLAGDDELVASRVRRGGALVIADIEAAPVGAR